MSVVGSIEFKKSRSKKTTNLIFHFFSLQQDMCYSPPYQPYFPQKVYPSTPPYRRYVTNSYYQGPPPEMYDPSSSSAPPPPTGSQLVPAASGPPHMEHYPGPPYYSSGYPPPGAPCYSRGMQPFMGKEMYDFCGEHNMWYW